MADDRAVNDKTLKEIKMPKQQHGLLKFIDKYQPSKKHGDVPHHRPGPAATGATGPMAFPGPQPPAPPAPLQGLQPQAADDGSTLAALLENAKDDRPVAEEQEPESIYPLSTPDRWELAKPVPQVRDAAQRASLDLEKRVTRKLAHRRPTIFNPLRDTKGWINQAVWNRPPRNDVERLSMSVILCTGKLGSALLSAFFPCEPLCQRA